MVKAIELFTKAAEQGDLFCMLVLAQKYENADGVDMDYMKAEYWYTKAAERGDTSAQCHLAQIYSYGIGVKQDRLKAYKWLLVATKFGADIYEGEKSFIDELSSTQIAEAEKLAEDFVEKYELAAD